MINIKYFLIYFALFIFLPFYASADIPNPDYYDKTCRPGEVEVICEVPGFAPDASQTNANDCDIYKNSNYYYLSQDVHSYGGDAKYCQINDNPVVNYGYYFIIFALAFVLEFIILMIAGYRDWRSFLAVLAANLVTVPLLQYVLIQDYRLPRFFAYSDIVIFEIGVIIIETIIIYLITRKNKFFLTLILVALANAVSAVLGSWIIKLLF